ncbi:uncharacterized protein OCT59_013663 [Rhizophagus irregularis]|uniref:uncharacterized protein n=1 Tax=Rhizophagus irregularis TaxID=588596 RepID=UPI001C1483EB|nr:hypothetical protein OCT59_013663 [Rhizophagus irregularis]CAB4479972.1 unnamed protein product [Rhizophagus irregularis]
MMVILFDKLVKKCGVLFTPLVPHYYNNNNSVQAGSITSGKLLKATEILSDIHMSVNNIGRLRYLVGKMRIFIHLAKEYLGVIHCVQTNHDLKINS